jgi:hypothetical protein
LIQERLKNMKLVTYLDFDQHRADNWFKKQKWLRLFVVHVSCYPIRAALEPICRHHGLRKWLGMSM